MKKIMSIVLATALMVSSQAAYGMQRQPASEKREQGSSNRRLHIGHGLLIGFFGLAFVRSPYGQKLLTKACDKFAAWSPKTAEKISSVAGSCQSGIQATKNWFAGLAGRTTPSSDVAQPEKE